MEFLDKIRGLPEWQRKAILWSTVVVVALLFFWAWTRNVKRQLERFPRQEVRERFSPPEMPRLELPSLEFSEFSQEELEKMMGELNEQEQRELEEAIKEHENRK